MLGVADIGQGGQRRGLHARRGEYTLPRPMKRVQYGGAILLLLGLSLFGCRERTSERTYAIRGRVVAVAANRQSVTLAHEEIPGYMPAMTMPFPVKDPRVLDGVEPGDEVEGELRVTEREGWIARLRVVKKGEPPSWDRSKALPIEYVMNPGDDVPDITLTDQEGRTFRLSEWRGKTIALTFIFTRCPFPNFCPLMSRRFVEAQEALRKRRAEWFQSDRVRFLTLSFDPEYDTPAVLKAYGERWNADFRHWTFATSPAIEMARFGASFGLSFWTEGGTITHNLVTAVIRPDGKVQAIFRGNEWTALDLVREIEAATR
jgi:protein SCO1